MMEIRLLTAVSARIVGLTKVCMCKPMYHGKCNKCGLSRVLYFNSEICKILESRGTVTNSVYTHGLPYGKDKGVCIHCGNNLINVNS
jgi:hypothetical protein